MRLPGALLSRLRRAAQDARFDGSMLARAEAVAPGQFDAIRLPIVHAWLRRLDDPAAVWARLFAYRDAVEPARVRQALGDEITSALEELGVLARDGDAVRSSLRLMPFADLLLASDEADARFDPVMGPGATTFELWRAVAVPRGARVLDVGCGAGSLALAAARHGAREVVGIDLDRRAVAYSQLNARLNDVPNATFEAGDLLEPVRGRSFDLVLSQPPFVMQPPSLDATTYLHGGSRGDELTLRLLAALPSVIAPDGRALVLADFPVDDGTGVFERIRAAIGSAKVQILAVTRDGLGPDQQSIGYAAATHSDLGRDYAALAATYREHLRALGITSTTRVLLDLHVPREGEPMFAAAVEARPGRFEAAWLAELETGLSLASAPASQLLAARVRPSRHAWLVQERSLAEPDRASYRVRFAEGHTPDQDLTEAAAALVELATQCDTVAEIVAAYAEACEATPDEVEGSVLPFVRGALVSGLLVRGEA
jgi:methylase of polypeptide subunit release factors